MPLPSKDPVGTASGAPRPALKPLEDALTELLDSVTPLAAAVVFCDSVAVVPLTVTVVPDGMPLPAASVAPLISVVPLGMVMLLAPLPQDRLVIWSTYQSL